MLLAAGLIGLGINKWENYQSRLDKEEAEQIAVQTETETQTQTETAVQEETAEETAQEAAEEMPASLKEVDLAALREVNEDVTGWISIPGTQISYPLVQTDNNDYYLNRNWKKEKNSAGAIFLECQNSPDFQNFNTIVYGHNRRNEAFFGTLEEYKAYSYWEENPYIYIVNDRGIFRYDIFAAKEVGTRTIIYGLDLQKEEHKKEFIRYALEDSWVNTGIVPDTDDTFLTLSTCTDYGYSNRWVVLAVLNEEVSVVYETGAEEETADAESVQEEAATEESVQEEVVTEEETASQETQPEQAAAQDEGFSLDDEMLVILEGSAAVPLTETAPAAQPAAVQAPAVLAAQASGVLQKAGNGAVIDYSNTKDGYVMVNHAQPSGQRLKVQVKGPTTTYTYNLSPQQWNVFPLSDGNGSYQVSVYKNVVDNKYAQLTSVGFGVELANEFAPFLRPNQYVNFCQESALVTIAAELTNGIADPLAKVDQIYEFVISHLSYDKQKAATVASGYLPVLDLVLAEGKGICFDYAALMTGMLRSQGVPCKLVVGYAGTAYHAWISVWTEGAGWVDGVIYFDGKIWHRMDPTFASSGNRSDSIMQYIGNGANYTTKYLY